MLQDIATSAELQPRLDTGYVGFIILWASVLKTLLDPFVIV